MSLIKQSVARKTLRRIYGGNHRCALGTPGNPLMPSDIARGLKPGQLCDMCEQMVENDLREMLRESKEK